MELKNCKKEQHIIKGAQDYEIYKWIAPEGYHFIGPDGVNYGHIIWAGKTLSTSSYALAPDKKYNHEKMDSNNSTNININNDNGKP